MMKIAGGCHCKGVRFEADVPREVEVLDCNCSICSATGFLHLIVPHERFRLEKGAELLTSYRFGTGAAEHLFCSVCGVKSFYQPRSHPGCLEPQRQCARRCFGPSHHAAGVRRAQLGACQSELG
jgi:hypothetical protein